jgi:AcrR family transcriptional regulator
MATADLTDDDVPRRAYDSPVRRQRAAETRQRIIAAGAELAHASSNWSMRDLTVRAVAERAAVNERTIYRHFATERELRDAILGHLQEEAGVSLDGLELQDFAALAARLVGYFSTFATTPRVINDPTLLEVDHRRRAALLKAIEPATPTWSDGDRAIAAAALDVFWSVSSHERMTNVWELDEQDAARAVSWVVGLVQQAIESGTPPPEFDSSR